MASENSENPFYRLLKILFISSLSFLWLHLLHFLYAQFIKLYRCRCSHIPGQHGTPHGFGWLSFFSRVCAGGFSCGSAQFALDLKEITICLWVVIVIYGSGAATMRARLYIYFHLPVFLRLSSVILPPTFLVLPCHHGGTVPVMPYKYGGFFRSLLRVCH